MTLPLTGGVERVFEVANHGQAVRGLPDDRNDIEAAGLIHSALSLQPCQRCTRDALLFPEVNGFKWLSGCGRASRFHFDKHDLMAIQGNDIDLAKAMPVLTFQNAIALLPEKVNGLTFAFVAK
jgi:hypothetical protein